MPFYGLTDPKKVYISARASEIATTLSERPSSTNMNKQGGV